jgi:ribosomal protein S18 acetylase RimI-like enzyme
VSLDDRRGHRRPSSDSRVAVAEYGLRELMVEGVAYLPGKIEIRRYLPRDRDDVRRLCCDTVRAGAPLGDLFVDREMFADLWTSWFTDIRPEATWIATRQGEGTVVGALSGCLDTAEWLAWTQTAWPIAIARAARRGTLLRRDAPLFLARNARLVVAAVARAIMGRSYEQARGYPAHLHIDVASDARASGVGKALVSHFLDQVRALRIPGVHAIVGASNTRALAFFERCGFVELARLPDQAFDSGPRPERVLLGTSLIAHSAREASLGKDVIRHWSTGCNGAPAALDEPIAYSASRYRQPESLDRA